MKWIFTAVLLFFLTLPNVFAQVNIWTETFDVAEKGYWGGGSDMSGISKWTIDASACTMLTTSDFIKTVTTGGGRIQAVNIDGEAVWRSEIIDITGKANINLSVNVSETGTSTNVNKYVKLYYSLNGGPESQFSVNGQNIGNFGSSVASENCLNGNSLQVIIRINNPNSGDATIFDNVSVSYDDQPPSVTSLLAISQNTLRIQFTEEIIQAVAENIANYQLSGIGMPVSAALRPDMTSVDLNFVANFTENFQYSISVTNMIDRCGNVMNPYDGNFYFSAFKPEQTYVKTNHELIIEFSHPLNKISAETINYYLVNNGIGNPISALLISDTLVNLVFGTDFSAHLPYNLTVSNVSDINGIVISSEDLSFVYHQVLPKDIIINEIMADPSPSAGLPEFEYLEIYNRTNYTIGLTDWKIKTGSTSKIIPTKNLGTDSYLIITSQTGANNLIDYGETIGIMGSTDLTNSGVDVVLITNLGLVSDSIKYTDTWYGNSVKDDGGWSLERIDPDNTCSRSKNWTASVDLKGGTPGKQNSNKNTNPDNIAPILQSTRAISEKRIQLVFNEELDISLLGNVNNYLLDGWVSPEEVQFNGDSSWIINLNFSTPFTIGNHNLLISNISDICGNIFAATNQTFSYYPGNSFDIVINEIMADVSPAPNVLPAAEYLEIYNKTDYNIDLTGWKLQLGSQTVSVFPYCILPAKSYLIVCSEDDTSNFSVYGQVAGILSSTALTSSGTQITIFNKQNVLVDYVKYEDSWYGDVNKSSGGWSLERVDPDNNCGENSNWKASTDFKGGTPCHQNSVYKTNPDNILPVLESTQVLSSNTLLLNFSKSINESDALNPLNYILDDGTNTPYSISFADSGRATLILKFTDPFKDGISQNLSISNLTDFCGNILVQVSAGFTYYLIHPTGLYPESDKILHLIFSEEVELNSAQNTDNYNIDNGFGHPLFALKHLENKNEVFLEFGDAFQNKTNYILHIENIKDFNGNTILPVDLSFQYFMPAKNDLVINEMLFNPKPGGVDFVEIYNKSGFSVDLSKLKLANRDKDGNLDQEKQISDKNYLYPSFHFLGITSDTNVTKINYPAPAYDIFVQPASLPSYNDDMGTIVLLYGDTIVDEFQYNDNMHYALLTNTEGISLERIDPEKPANLLTNWSSAAESYGFATPANKNSQFHQSASQNSQEIIVEPETFSPDNDGRDDRLFIRYQFGEPGYVANVNIYDGHGRIIKKIAENVLLATDGEFSWDGLNQDNTKARIGIYIVYFEAFNLKGEVQRFKKPCVLAGRID
ncbi:MAG: lamin tail domain-containing protein [Bacteroidales bacterium]